MENKEVFCQSCGMPLTKDEEKGTNKDGSKNEEYCVYCYGNGEFLEDLTLEEMIAASANYAEEAGLTVEEMLKQAREGLPTLKRWKKD
ncbi:MAG: zinc ribbon domain-containing protein [Oscillospiraceae bacterium]|nr:zinc ribbon domain-containing protein [Oscillospiraceae bacterium]